MSKIKGVGIFAVGMLVTAPAYAYLDGGTGSVIVQMLFAGLAGLIALARLYWEKLKATVVSIKRWITRKPAQNAAPTSKADTHHDKTR